MKKYGFTLIELMISVTIIGVLLGMLLPRVGLLIDRAREKTTGKNIKNIYTAIIQFSERRYGRMIWPAIDPSPNDVLVQVLTTTLPSINPEGPPFDEVPPALLRRTAKEGMIPPGDPITTQNNRFYASENRTWAGIAGGDRNRGGWCYITAGTYTGEVFVNSSVPDTFGVIYSTYLCW